MLMRDVSGGPASESGDADAVSMLVPYRHDVHKARGRSHAQAADWLGDVRVNESVPLNADRDAAVLSRPRGRPRDTIPAHQSRRRVPLLRGAEALIDEVGDVDAVLYDLVSIEDAAALHRAWLDASVPALFSESRYYPTTSLKYHSLLVAALLDNYRAGHGFDDLFLAVTRHDPDEVATIVPHRTVLTTPWFALHVTGEPGEWPAARLGAVPARSFADTWARLPVHPVDVDSSRQWRVVDAQLRRVRAWSTALQYLDAFTTALNTDESATPVAGWSV